MGLRKRNCQGNGENYIRSSIVYTFYLQLLRLLNKGVLDGLDV